MLRLFRICRPVRAAAQGYDHDGSTLWRRRVRCPGCIGELCLPVYRKPLRLGRDKPDQRCGLFRIYHEQYGIYLPHKASAQAGYGTRVSASEARPGDLFFYSNGSGINHVAIYIGNGQVVHASTPKSGIKISNAFYRTPACVTRLLGD